MGVEEAYAAVADRYIELFGSPDHVHPDDLALIERPVASSAEGTDANASNRVEVLAVAGHEPESMFERGRCDERVG